MPVGSGGRYIPPHLRGKSGSGSGSSGGSSNGRTNSSNGSIGGGNNSRWKNLDNAGGSDKHNGQRYGGRRGGPSGKQESRNGGRTPAVANGSNSRWANVDRSAIESGQVHSSSRFANHRSADHRNFPRNGRFRKGSEEDDSHRAHARAVFFGDSFIKLFGLLNEYSDSVLRSPRKIEVQKYKAASAKGLCREGNENRAAIVKTMEAIREGHRNRSSSSSSSTAYQHLERLVFCFGSVDVHLSFYYKKYVKGQALSDDDLRAVANDYVDFVQGLETGSDVPLKKLIVGIYPSPLSDRDVGSSLLAYGSLETEDQIALVDASDDKLIELRQARVDLFNQALKERCDYHNNNNNNNNHGKSDLEYWDVRDEILTHDETDGRPRVRDAYKDVSDLNIHLVHETTLQLWVQKWPWYEALTTTTTTDSAGNLGTKITFLEYLQKTFDEYRKTKPWAERKHVAETRGVVLS